MKVLNFIEVFLGFQSSELNRNSIRAREFWSVLEGSWGSRVLNFIRMLLEFKSSGLNWSVVRGREFWSVFECFWIQAFWTLTWLFYPDSHSHSLLSHPRLSLQPRFPPLHFQSNRPHRPGFLMLLGRGADGVEELKGGNGYWKASTHWGIMDLQRFWKCSTARLSLSLSRSLSPVFRFLSLCLSLLFLSSLSLQSLSLSCCCICSCCYLCLCFCICLYFCLCLCLGQGLRPCVWHVWRWWHRHRNWQLQLQLSSLRSYSSPLSRAPRMVQARLNCSLAKKGKWLVVTFWR